MKEVYKKIQHCLSSLGFYTGAIDGGFGWGSYSAVLRLLEAKNNKQDMAHVKTAKSKNIVKELQQILVDNRVYFGAIDGDFGKASITALNSLIPAPKLTDANLNLIYKNCAVGFSKHINDLAKSYGVVTKADMCAFLASNIHESSGFRSLRENMNYSAPRLLQVFEKYFKNLASAQSIVSQGQIAICDVVYGGRMGNRKGTRDGYDFRGGGTIHLTGRDNYTLCSKEIGEPNLLTNPDCITTPLIAVKTALWFWKKNKCSIYANEGNALKTYSVVNGGDNGLKERISIHSKAWRYL